MKQLLPILLCYVLMTTQVYAISGGPTFGGGSKLNPIGVYSGIIQVKSETDFDNPVIDPNTGAPILDPNTGKTIPTVNTNVNALGLFSLGVPTTNVATGAFLIFVDGIVFRGTITASVNPDRDQINGVINGTYNYTVYVSTTSTTTTSTGTTTTTTTTPEQITAQANGQIAANITATRSNAISSATLTGKSIVAVNDGRLGGNSGLQFVTDRSLNCTVSGFRQSTTYSDVGTTVGSTTTGG